MAQPPATRHTAAITRLPVAPLLPAIADGITPRSYELYREWAESAAKEHQTEPVSVEWALFTLGGEIRESLRA
jgi:hypothetical protein